MAKCACGIYNHPGALLVLEYVFKYEADFWGLSNIRDCLGLSRQYRSRPLH